MTSERELEGNGQEDTGANVWEWELMHRICLGILKTDQWKPNSKMNQGKSKPLIPTLFFARLGAFTKERENSLELQES